MFNTPIVFIIYNRPKVTAKVFEQIRKIKPKRLFVVADGPKTVEDEIKCEVTRNVIDVDWDCELKTLFRSSNLGCKKSVSEGISYAFNEVDQLIILEDDTVPDLTFFTYCQNLLHYHRSNKKVMSITGVSWLFGRNFFDHSYYFSRYAGIWGWATWKDRWQLFDSSINSIRLAKYDFLEEIAFSQEEMNFHINNFKGVLNNTIDSWGFIWHYTHFINNVFCIVPRVNLIKNIGFGNSATHTKNEYSWKANRKSFSITFPLQHPKAIQRNEEADFFISRRNFLNKFTFKDKILDKFYELL